MQHNLSIRYEYTPVCDLSFLKIIMHLHLHFLFKSLGRENICVKQYLLQNEIPYNEINSHLIILIKYLIHISLMINYKFIENDILLHYISNSTNSNLARNELT